MAALEQLISPTTRGDPTNPLRWTCKSTRSLAAELRNQGFAVGGSTVRELLVELGYSLQGNRKTREGNQHPDRNAQFEHINARVKARKRRGEPALSVDTKKKEKLGNKSNSGREYEPKGHPRETDTHDFLDKKKGKVVPYGVYDIHRNEAVVAIGSSHDTAEFAVAAIRLWWTKLGKDQYALAGIMDATAMLAGRPSYWNFYVKVPDTDAALAQAKELGGSELMAPSDTPYGRLASIEDPTGVAFMVMGPNLAP